MGRVYATQCRSPGRIGDCYLINKQTSGTASNLRGPRRKRVRQQPKLPPQSPECAHPRPACTILVWRPQPSPSQKSTPCPPPRQPAPQPRPSSPAAPGSRSSRATPPPTASSSTPSNPPASSADPAAPPAAPSARTSASSPRPRSPRPPASAPASAASPPASLPKPDPQAEAIAKAATFLTTHAGERTKLDDLATAAGLGKFALQRGFKRVLGVTPGEFAREQRKTRFREKVRTPKLSITDAVYEAGFGSSSRLYEGVDQTLGMSPTAMKSGGAGETIHYTTTDSPLGRILVATTTRGLCAVLFGDADADARPPAPRAIPPGRPPPLHLRRRTHRSRRLRPLPPLRTPHRRNPPLPRPRHRLPAARLAGPPRDPPRRNPHLLPDRRSSRLPQSRPRRRHRLRLEPPRRRHPLPPRRRLRWQTHRLSLGHRPQTPALGTRTRNRTYETGLKHTICVAKRG